MADDRLDWHLERDSHGGVVLVVGGDRVNLGQRDEAFVRFADFMGDEGRVEQDGPGDFGAVGRA